MDTPGYYLYSLSILGLVLGVILLGGWLLRRYGPASLARLTGRGGQPRLSISAVAALDPKRRLVIIRRDDVEHLLLVGGTQDLHLEGPFPAASLSGTSHTFSHMLVTAGGTGTPPPPPAAAATPSAFASPAAFSPHEPI